MNCENCEKLKDELARAQAEKDKFRDALVRYTDKLLTARRVIDQALNSWAEK